MKCASLYYINDVGLARRGYFEMRKYINDSIVRKFMVGRHKRRRYLATAAALALAGAAALILINRRNAAIRVRIIPSIPDTVQIYQPIVMPPNHGTTDTDTNSYVF